MTDGDRYAVELALHEMRQVQVAGDPVRARVLLAAMIEAQAVQGADERVIEMMLFTSFFMGDMAAAERVMAVHTHGCGPVRLTIGTTPPLAQHFVWRHEPGLNSFEFHPDLFQLSQDMIYTIHTRWAAWLNMVCAYTGLRGRPGAGLVDVGDWAFGAGMMFCDNRPGSHLVPDSSFLQTDGYRSTLRAFEVAPVAWDRRKPAALWRGGSTGVSETGAMDLPRVRLCQMAQHPSAEGLVDAGITEAVQVTEVDAALLRAMGLMRDRMPVSEFHNYKYQIDVDGNSCSWPGLFQKLLTGSPVLKIASSENYRQWYYDRLIPWYNYVPVRSDMADLLDIIRYLNSNDSIAEKIGAAGLALARSMDNRNEAMRCLPTIEAAFTDHAFKLSRH